MKICVLGLWHLGSVTAGCLAAAGHTVTGLDFDAEVIANLSKGVPPLYEPGLEDLIRQGLADGRLTFTTDAGFALREIDLLWVSYDTPVDEDDQADVAYVLERTSRALAGLKSPALVLISSQLPVGSIRLLEERLRDTLPTGTTFACSPENLRLGRAIDAFNKPARIVAGVRNDRSRELLGPLFSRYTDHIEWMTVESAEMTKHALNAFLAASVSFINEIAVLCEKTGADAREVERALKSEPRIGPRAYLTPGGAFAGGTLARDVAFLTGIGAERGATTCLLQAIRQSNDAHRQWAKHKLGSVFETMQDRAVAVWGLAYKAGTDTLRRSASVELCRWLASAGARVRAHDPAVKRIPEELTSIIALCSSPEEALAGADALVIATEWPQFTTISAETIVRAMRTAIVFDVGRFLARQLDSRPDVRYFTVGKP
ncbi:MAG TPA: nucleotide sugar dehydrogenase [Terriglobia bacterium]|nr:nucleotide sugar dehydrogenase [Terriglobia bacterium]